MANALKERSGGVNIFAFLNKKTERYRPNTESLDQLHKDALILHQISDQDTSLKYLLEDETHGQPDLIPVRHLIQRQDYSLVYFDGVIVQYKNTIIAIGATAFQENGKFVFQSYGVGIGSTSLEKNKPPANPHDTWILSSEPQDKSIHEVLQMSVSTRYQDSYTRRLSQYSIPKVFPERLWVDAFAKEEMQKQVYNGVLFARKFGHHPIPRSSFGPNNYEEKASYWLHYILDRDNNGNYMDIKGNGIRDKLTFKSLQRFSRNRNKIYLNSTDLLDYEGDFSRLISSSEVVGSDEKLQKSLSYYFPIMNDPFLPNVVKISSKKQVEESLAILAARVIATEIFIRHKKRIY